MVLSNEKRDAERKRAQARAVSKRRGEEASQSAQVEGEGERGGGVWPTYLAAADEG